MPGGPELSEKIPDEIFQLVESFKKFVREQKAYRDQKLDVDPILEVDKEVEDSMLAFQRVSVDCEASKQLIEQIRNDTTKLLRQAELAYSVQRANIENNANLQQPQNLLFQQQQQQQQQSQFSNLGHTSSQYFADLADQFESRMRGYGNQIKELKMSLDSMSNVSHNADDLYNWLMKQHELLREIAAKVYMAHEKILELELGNETVKAG